MLTLHYILFVVAYLKKILQGPLLPNYSE